MNNLRAILLLVSLALLFPLQAQALDSSTIRDIKKADSMGELSELAEEIAKDAGDATPADSQEAELLAAETEVYLKYIEVRQNEFIEKILKKILEKEDM